MDTPFKSTCLCWYTGLFLKPTAKLCLPRGVSGLWNGAGRKVIYTAESIPRAFLENMIRRKGAGFNGDFKTMIIETGCPTYYSDRCFKPGRRVETFQ